MTKRAMRAAARERLAAMSSSDRASASARIAERALSVPEISGASALLMYASLPTEVATDAIAAAARARGITVTYPRCLSESREMVLHRVDEAEALHEGGLHGIREPALHCPIVALEDIDAALVPGLAWDRQGHRLGRGAGYYDRLFANPRWRGFRAGLFFAAQEIPAIPPDHWDADLHAVITENEIWRAD